MDGVEQVRVVAVGAKDREQADPQRGGGGNRQHRHQQGDHDVVQHHDVLLS